MNTATEPRHTTDTKTVTVYVRLGETDDRRRLSFARPDGMTTQEVLDANIAFDGNQCVAYANEDGLLEIEKLMVTWFGTHGYEVEFK